MKMNTKKKCSIIKQTAAHYPFYLEGIGDIVLYVEGNLVIGQKNFEQVKPIVLEVNYDRVFCPRVDLSEVSDYLNMDIDLLRISRRKTA